MQQSNFFPLFIILSQIELEKSTFRTACVIKTVEILRKGILSL